jgi:hypothetical protein
MSFWILTEERPKIEVSAQLLNKFIDIATEYRLL